MHKPRFSVFTVFVLSLLLLPACASAGAGGGADSGAQSQNAGARAGGAAAPAEAQAAGEQKVFRGSVGAYPARMSLRRAPGGELTGSYSYEGRGGSLTLKGRVDAKGRFTLDEFDGAKQTGTFKGDWDEKDYSPEASLNGNWTKPGGGGEQYFYFVEQWRAAGGAPAVTTKQVREENKKRGYTVNAEYPQFEGAAGFNRAAEAFVAKEVAEFKKDAGRDPGEKDYSPDAAEDSLNVTYRVRLVTPELVSVEFPIDYYPHGAAHPSHAFRVINYDQKAGRELSLADLFRPGSDYLKKISEVAVAQLRRWNKDSADYSGSGGESYLGDGGITEGAAPKAENYQNWTLTPRGLVVTFDYYQLGSYAAGAQTVVLPYADLKDVLRADGPAAPFVK
ncbi:MAG TPA: RsiV family protein [Pyrinomonadaceae bacterium]|jgi:hypothetical protein